MNNFATDAITNAIRESSARSELTLEGLRGIEDAIRKITLASSQTSSREIVESLKVIGARLLKIAEAVEKIETKGSASQGCVAASPLKRVSVKGPWKEIDIDVVR